MQTQLNDFFKIVEQMSAVDTSGLEPLHTPLSAIGNVELRLRPDAVTETDHRERNMANAPSAEDGLFLVPKVIE
jgi:aspartyl-tRNA(Asn)/glutamyl-tRNA(Gln) amidotransferase subunit C